MATQTTIERKDDLTLVLTDNKEVEYKWQVGVAGELIIYKQTLHAMLSAKGDLAVWQVIAAGQWLSAIDEKVDEE